MLEWVHTTDNIMSSSDPSPASCRRCCFVEIVHPDPTPPPEEWIDCYVMTDVDPKSCGSLARDLNASLPLRGSVGGTAATSDATTASATAGNDDDDDDAPPLPRTDHLKRIRRRPATAVEMRARKEAAAAAAMTAEEGGAPTTTPDYGDDDAASSSTMGGAIDGGHRPAKKRARNGGGDAGRRRRTAATGVDVTARPWSLDVLVGSVAAVDRAIRAEEDDFSGGKSMSSYTSSLGSVLGSHGAPIVVGGAKSNLVRRSLPGRPAGTRDELEAWNATSWPTLFFEERTARYREDVLALTHEEARAMAAGMAEAVEDALEGRRQRGGWREEERNDCTRAIPAGAVVTNPLDGSIVSRSSEERRLRVVATTADGGGEGGSSGAVVARTSSDAPGVAAATATTTATTTENSEPSFLPGGDPDDDDPLCTSVLLAIQGVSRRERLAAAGCGMGSEEFRAGQVSFCEIGGGRGCRIDPAAARGRRADECVRPLLNVIVPVTCLFLLAFRNRGKYLCTG